MKLPIALAAITLLSLAACSPGPASDAATDEAEYANASESMPEAEASVAPPAAPVDQGDCDLLTSEEVSAAFGGKLTVARASGRGGRGGSCTYSLAEVSESELIIQVGNEASYLARRDGYADQSSVSMEPLALGKEAFAVNGGAQIIALNDKGQSLSVGLVLFVFNQPLPMTKEELEAGVESLSRIAFERM
ncbi:hypothetical protein [Arenimonas alkanexedens]